MIRNGFLVFAISSLVAKHLLIGTKVLLLLSKQTKVTGNFGAKDIVRSDEGFCASASIKRCGVVFEDGRGKDRGEHFE
jgi:hypothetical protein